MNTLQSSIVKQQLENVVVYLEAFLGLANCHMVDYFTKNWFSRYISQPIAEEIYETGPRKMIELILNSETEKAAPALHEFITNCKNFSLYNNRQICLTPEKFLETLSSLGGSPKSRLKLEVFMSEKKSHEVEVLSSLSATIAEVVKSTHIIDIGDGKGYLSSMLAFQYNFPVLGVDAKLVNTESASKRAEKLGKLWPGIEKSPKKSLPRKETRHNQQPNNLYKQVTQFVTEETDFMKLISEKYAQEGRDITLVGLHTCGNLAADSLRIYNANKDIKAICNVSCCYHLMTEKYEISEVEESKFGFPMSKFLLERNLQLGRPTRSLSAQSIDRILYHKGVPTRILFYRAVLQVLLQTYCIELPEKNVGKIKKACNNFAEYVRYALKKLEIDLCLSDEELEKIFDHYSHREHEMVTFCLIRCMLAPVIESAILLDRLLYLFEQGHENSYLVQLFDPVISPRCYGIVSMKN